MNSQGQYVMDRRDNSGRKTKQTAGRGRGKGHGSTSHLEPEIEEDKEEFEFDFEQEVVPVDDLLLCEIRKFRMIRELNPYRFADRTNVVQHQFWTLTQQKIWDGVYY